MVSAGMYERKTWNSSRFEKQLCRPEARSTKRWCAARVLGAAVLVLCLCGGSRGQLIQLDPGSEKMLKSGDVEFALKAAQSCQGIIKLGQLAAQKSESANTRAFAQQMIDEHAGIGRELQSVAADQHLTLPGSLNGRDQEAFTKLQNESGAKFERDYLKVTLAGRKDDLKQFQREAKKGKDPALKNFAEENLPKLEECLRKTQVLRSSAA
jgi:putative membrane protein